MSWGEEKYTILQRMEEIKKCLDNQMWQAALSLSLTLPDICGKIEFPYMIKNGKETESSNSYRYKEWFKKYTEKYFEYKENLTQDGQVYFNAEMCWSLRNVFLHSGADKDERTEYQFKLSVNSVDSFEINNNSDVVNVTLDVKQLCQNIISSAKYFYNTWSDKEDFNKLQCVWIDVNRFSEEFRKANHM